MAIMKRIKDCANDLKTAEEIHFNSVDQALAYLERFGCPRIAKYDSLINGLWWRARIELNEPSIEPLLSISSNSCDTALDALNDCISKVHEAMEAQKTN